MDERASRRVEVAALLILTTALAAAVIAAQPLDVFWGADNANRFIQLRSWLHTHSFAIDIPTLRGIHFVTVGGKAYSIYSPNFALLSAPLYQLFGLPGLMVPALAGTLAVICLLPRFAPRSVLLTGIVLVFATPLFWYTVVYWEHTLFVALVLAALALAERDRVLVAGLVAGAATLLREEGYIAVASVALALLLARRSARAAAAFGIAAAAVLAPWWIANFNAFGNALGIHAQFYGLISHGSKIDNVFPYLFELSSNHRLALWLSVPFAALAAASPFRLPRPLRAALFAAAGAASLVLAFLLARNGQPLRELLYAQGLFVAVPFGTTLFLALGWLWKEQRFRVVTLMAGIALTTAAVTQDFGVIWGPRYYLWLLPLMIVLGCQALGEFLAIDDRAQIAATVSACLLLAASFALQTAGLRILRQKLTFSERLLTAVRADRSPVVVTDVFWVPEELASMLYEKPVLLVTNDAEFLRGVAATEGPFLYIGARSPRRLSNAALRPAMSRAVRRQRIAVADLDVMLVDVGPRSAGPRP